MRYDFNKSGISIALLFNTISKNSALDTGFGELVPSDDLNATP